MINRCPSGTRLAYPRYRENIRRDRGAIETSMSSDAYPCHRGDLGHLYKSRLLRTWRVLCLARN